MNPEQILLSLVTISPWLIVKIFILVLLLLYLVFATIVWRQVSLMNQMVEAQISPLLATVALLHVAAAVFLFLFALIIL